jgi:hypothetical protein
MMPSNLSTLGESMVMAEPALGVNAWSDTHETSVFSRRGAANAPTFVARA